MTAGKGITKTLQFSPQPRNKSIYILAENCHSGVRMRTAGKEIFRQRTINRFFLSGQLMNIKGRRNVALSVLLKFTGSVMPTAQSQKINLNV